MKRIALSLVVAGIALTGCGPREPASGGGPPQIRRLTEAQFRNVIADVFGSDVKIVGRFEPEIRRNGLLALGQSVSAVTPAGLEQLELTARALAAQATDKEHRTKLLPCAPADEKAPDDACAGQIAAKFGRVLFRRPLQKDETATLVALAKDAATNRGDFYAGAGAEISTLLVSPEFLFRSDDVAQGKLTAYAKATRVSFLLWNTNPDDELLKAAEKGDLDSRSGLVRQVDRLLASPRLEDGVRAFFSDMLSFNDFDTLVKDPQIYPRYLITMGQDLREASLRTIVDQVVTKNGDYRDLYSSRKTFLNRGTALLYRVPAGATVGWQSHEFTAEDEAAGARAGIVTDAGFLALHSPAGRSSPTLRGRAVRELVLCQKVPDPPPNVDFTLVQDVDNPQYKTVRERLSAHATNPVCAGCHKLTDPIGLALENFDGAGVYRTQENGKPIDASGNLNGAAFDGPEQLAKAIHDDPATASCAVSRLYEYAAGRTAQKDEAPWMDYLNKQFAANGYRFRDLMRQIATSDAFYKISTGAP